MLENLLITQHVERLVRCLVEGVFHSSVQVTWETSPNHPQTVLRRWIGEARLLPSHPDHTTPPACAAATAAAAGCVAV